jgi:tetratricopeptide (TPR) repeat protein
VKPAIIIGLAPLLLLAQGPASDSFDRISAQARDAWNANRSQEAAELFTRAVNMRPDWGEGWWALATLDYDASRYEACRDHLNRLTQIDPSAPAGWALLGLCEFETKQFESSFEHLKRAHMLAPPGSGGQLLDVADYHLGLLLTRQGAFELSQEILLRVAEHVKDNAAMLVGCGLATLRMPMLPSEIHPSQKEVVALAGKAFWDLSTRPPAAAQADFATLLTKFPAFPNVHYLYGTYLAAHQPDKAAGEFLAELRITPDSVPARVQLALRYLVEQRVDEALKMAREAVALSPDSVGTQLTLGRVLRAKGDHPAALRAFLEAKRLDAVSPEIRLYLTTEYRTLGMKEEMRREQAEHDRLKAEQANWP